MGKAWEITFWPAFGASLPASLLTSIRIYVIRHFERGARNNGISFVCFGAGGLMSVSFLHQPQGLSHEPQCIVYLSATGNTKLH